MARKGIGKLEDLSRIIDISPSTLSRNIANLEKSQNPTSKFAIKLSAALGVTGEQLLEGGDAIPDDRFFERLDSVKLRDFSKLSTDYLREISQVVDSLPAKSVYTFATCEEPLEFDPTETRFKKRLAAAIKRGVTFRYVFPAPDVYRGGSGSAPMLRNLATETVDLIKFFDDFKNDLELTYGLSAALINDHVLFATTDNRLIVHPFYRVIYYSTLLMGMQEEKVFFEASTGSIAQLEDHKCWYPVPRNIAQLVIAAIDQIFPVNTTTSTTT